jgi:hypothetical protein
MSQQVKKQKAVRFHLTNIAGLGAVQLLQSLLPALEQQDYQIEEIYLPACGELSHYKATGTKTRLLPYKRYLPNSISRFLECILLGYKFDGKTPLLVFGDIPIRCKTKQTVFVQTPLLVQNIKTDRQLDAIKYWVAKWLFRCNMRYVSNFIVQTEAMKSALIGSYPETKDRVHVIAQPVPVWLIASQLKRLYRHVKTDSGLRLFYPAAVYPHKNHRLLNAISSDQTYAWPIYELLLTIPERLNPNPAISWIYCVDTLTPDAVIKTYQATDALLFLSLSESFGFPLVEAMWIGLPIICPDLPYARTLCGNQAIYFNPKDINSLREAVVELKTRLDSGWWPEWSENLKAIPQNWNEVAASMLLVATHERDMN